MDVEEFKKDYMDKYADVMKRMAIQPDCEFRIFVYERSSDFIALIDNDITRWEKGRSVNNAIEKLKRTFPELQDEYGVRYFPLDKSCY